MANRFALLTWSPASHRDIAGRTLAERQLAFALATGCTTILLRTEAADPRTADAAQEAAVDAGSVVAGWTILQHQAEKAGAKLRRLEEVSSLLAAVGFSDTLLVIAPTLVPLVREWPGDADAGAPASAAILTVGEEDARRAGFERIDAESHWAGAMLVPGRAVAVLDELPEDVEPVSALLRIACARKLPRQPVPPACIAAGLWSDSGAPGATERLERQLTEEAGRQLALPSEQALLAAPVERLRMWAVPALVGVSAVASVAMSVMWSPLGGLAAAAVSALGAAALRVRRAKRNAAFLMAGLADRSAGPLALAVDALLALGGAVALADDHGWTVALFVMTVLLVATRIAASGLGLRWLEDRVILAVILLAAAFVPGALAPAVMAIAVAVLVWHWRAARAPRG